mgnify:CR=1 FL=1
MRAVWLNFIKKELMSIHDIVYEMLVIEYVNARGNGKPKLFASFLQVTSRV